MHSKRTIKVISCDNELYHYIRMIDLFQNQMNDPDKADIWKNIALIRLMDLLDLMKCNKNEEFVKNSLILLMALSNETPADMYSSRGVDVANLSTKDRKKVVSLMKAEVLVN